MKEFENWIKQKTFYRKDTELHIAASFAWRAALEWVKKEAISLDERGDANRNVINRELES